MSLCVALFYNSQNEVLFARILHVRFNIYVYHSEK